MANRYPREIMLETCGWDLWFIPTSNAPKKINKAIYKCFFVVVVLNLWNAELWKKLLYPTLSISVFCQAYYWHHILSLLVPIHWILPSLTTSFPFPLTKSILVYDTWQARWYFHHGAFMHVYLRVYTMIFAVSWGVGGSVSSVRRPYRYCNCGLKCWCYP